MDLFVSNAGFNECNGRYCQVYSLPDGACALAQISPWKWKLENSDWCYLTVQRHQGQHVWCIGGSKTLDRCVYFANCPDRGVPPLNLEWHVYRDHTLGRDPTPTVSLVESPGFYRLILAASISATHELDSETMGLLPPGTVVNVVRVLRCETMRRIRGRLSHPDGWISLRCLDGKTTWAMPTVAHPTSHSPTLYSGLWANREFTDCKVVRRIDDEVRRVWHVHRCVLASASPVLRQMLLSDMKEAHLCEIAMQSAEADIEAFLYYIYNSTLPPMCSVPEVCVSNATVHRCNGDYSVKLLINERKRYSNKHGSVIYFQGGRWKLDNDAGATQFFIRSNDTAPPCTEWSNSDDSETCSVNIAVVADEVARLRWCALGLMELADMYDVPNLLKIAAEESERGASASNIVQVVQAMNKRKHNDAVAPAYKRIRLRVQQESALSDRVLDSL